MSSAPAVGCRTWVFSGGRIPESSTGHEPELTSNEQLDLLNHGEHDATVEITVLFEHDDPVGPFTLRVPGRRIRPVRINDLIDPHAIPLGVPFGLVVRSDGAIVAQLTRTDTREGHLSVAVAPGFAADP